MKSIKVNFLYNAVYQLLLIILPLITTPYISHVLGADGVGTHAYTYTTASYFLLFAMLGVKNYGNRSVAAVREDKEALSRVFGEIYGLQLVCSLAALLIYMVYVSVFAQDYLQLGCIQGIYLLAGMLDISWLFFGLEEFRITVSRNIIIRLADLVLIFLLVRSRSDLWKYSLILAAGTLISQGYLWFYVRRFIDWQKPALTKLVGHLKAELILFVPVIAVSLYKMMDKLMLGQMSNMMQVGFYENVEKIQNIPLGLITALGTVMLPRMSNLAAKGQVGESRRYITASISFAVAMASAMMFGLAAIARDFIPLFLGEEFYDCILLLQMMSPTILFIAWANVIRTQYLIPNHMDKSYIISVIAGAAVNLIINAILIPGYAAKGAVIGTICAEGTVCVLQTIMVRRKLPVTDYLKMTFPFLLCGAGMAAFIWGIRRWFPQNAVGLIIEILSGGVVYVIAAGVYYIQAARKIKSIQEGE